MHPTPALDDVRDYYRQHADLVSSPFGVPPHVQVDLLQRVFQRLHIDLNDKRVLDVGCGRGGLASFCLANARAYLGMDIVLDHLQATPGALYVQAGAQHLPLAAGSHDVVLCVDVFEHLPRQAEVLAGFHRALAPGGRVFLSVPNYSNVAGLLKWRYERSGRYAPGTWAPFGRWKPQAFEQFMTPRRVARLLHAAGFVERRMIGLERETLHGLLPWLLRGTWHEGLVYRLERWLGPPCSALGRIAPWLSLHTLWSARRP